MPNESPDLEVVTLRIPSDADASVLPHDEVVMPATEIVTLPHSNHLYIEPTDSAETARPALPFPVVGFGGSAGGLQAFREVLEKLPSSTGMAFVVVSHLAPDQRSYLVEILEKHAPMPVVGIANDMQPEPDHIYVLLPNHYVRLEGGRFRLYERKAEDRTPTTIDTFFRSLADDQGPLAIGIVMSGADSDGAQGLITIKGEGGFAMVQEPDTATNGEMPRNAIAADHVDLVLPASALALEFVRLSEDFRKQGNPAQRGSKERAEDPESYTAILALLRSLSGLELRRYKPQTIQRRLARRMMLLRMETMADYLHLLKVSPDELRILQEDILIKVTGFFRDPEVWESIRTNLLPAIFRDRPANKPVRVWSAGCSTGEEAYSLAMLLLEYTQTHRLDTPIQVFGTDVSDRNIDSCRTATYPDTITSTLSAERMVFLPSASADTR